MKSTVTPLRGRRVLLVEDNAINRAIARSFLESASCEAEDAYNGAQALDKLCAHVPDHFDLVLMDLQMPVMDGYEAARHIRALHDPPTLRHSDRDDDGQRTGAGLRARARLRRVAAFIKAHRLYRPARGAVRGPARKLTTNRNPSNKKYAVESSTAYFSFLETAYFAIAR